MFFTYRHTKEWSFFRWAFRLYNWCDSPPNQCPSLSDPTEDLFWNLLPTSRGFHHQQNSQIRHAWNLMETHPMYVLVVVSIGWLQFFTYRKCLEISKFSSMKKKNWLFRVPVVYLHSFMFNFRSSFEKRFEQKSSTKLPCYPRNLLEKHLHSLEELTV